MNPNGISADVTLYMGENRIFYLGETEADGYSQAVQFELKGSAHCKLFFNTDSTVAGFKESSAYKIVATNGKFKLWADGGEKANGPWTSTNNFQKNEFRSYVVR